jgi:hypothetical protein
MKRKLHQTLRCVLWVLTTLIQDILLADEHLVRFGQNMFSPMCKVALTISLMLRNLHREILSISSRHSV